MFTDNSTEATPRQLSPPLQAGGTSPSQGWAGSLKAGAVAWALSLFMAAPPFSTWSWNGIKVSRASDFLQLTVHPLGRDLREGMLAYRIATPFLAWLLHLPPLAALALPFVFSLGALVVIHRAVSVRSSPTVATAAAIGVACSSTFHFSHWCLGVPDSLTHLCTAIALIAGPVGAAAAVLLGCLNDERAVLALPFIALWRLPASHLPDIRPTGCWSPLAKAAGPAALGLLAAVVVRHLLTVGVIGPGIAMPSLYGEMAETLRKMQPWLGSWAIWFANWLIGPGWLWCLIAAPCCSSRWRPNAGTAGLFAAAFLAACLSTFLVADVARSIGFAYPAALLGCIWMYERAPRTACRLALLTACLQVATPAVWLYQHWQWLQFRPLPWECWLLLNR